MLDPLLLLIIRVGFGLLFLLAALHKLGDRDQFRGILEAYQLLPQNLLAPVALGLPVFELLLGAGWLVMGSSPVIALLSALILTVYTLSIGVNLQRGRLHIDCGCGFASSGGKATNNNNVQQLSYSLLIRNAFLIVVALIAAVPVSQRQLGLIDMLFVLLASLAFILLYAGFNQLTTNNNAIGAWRNPRA